MHITISGDDSISGQARAYAEYRLFSSLSQLATTAPVQRASLVLRRARSRRPDQGIRCTLTVESSGGDVTRLRTFGEHPYAAINRAVERFSVNSRTGRPLPSPHDGPRRRLSG